MERKEEDKLGKDVRKRLKTFYSATDPQWAEAVAKEIIAELNPLLERWAKSLALKLPDPMWDEDDLCAEAQRQLLMALLNSRSAEPITNIFGYAQRVVLNFYLRIRQKNDPIQRGPEGVEDGEDTTAPDPAGAFFIKEAIRQDCDTGWKALAQCPLNGRKVLLLSLTRENIYAWIGLPDPLPEFARMLEIDEASAREYWKCLRIEDEEIATKLGTSKGNVHKLRSKIKEKLRNIIYGVSKE